MTLPTTSRESQIGNLLRKRGLKLATAESCTGGLIASHLTDVPGSSDYFLGGIVAYAYEVKVALLNVSWETLKEYGAVSRETVLEMARGARKALSADLAISVSGSPISLWAPRGSGLRQLKGNGRISTNSTGIAYKTNRRRLTLLCKC